MNELSILEKILNAILRNWHYISNIDTHYACATRESEMVVIIIAFLIISFFLGYLIGENSAYGSIIKTSVNDSMVANAKTKKRSKRHSAYVPQKDITRILDGKEEESFFE